MSKSTEQRTERLLAQYRAREGNDKCADCGASNPRWASWNLGIWLCVKCATIHRRMGTHISKVKSLSLDIWTREQVDGMRDNGNIKSNSKYWPDRREHPLPLDLESDHAQSPLELFIFQKYRDKAFMAKSSSKSKRDEEPAGQSSLARRRDERGAPSLPSSSRSAGTSSTPATPATPTVSVSATPKARPLRPVSPAELPALPPKSNAQLSPQRGVNAHVARAMTAPLPQHSNTASPAASMPTTNAFNPFHRHMTASAQIPSTGGTYTPQPYLQQNSNAFAPGMQPFLTAQTPALYNSTYTPIPQMQQQMPKGEVWNDLAGLSLSGPNTTAFTPQYQPMNAFTPQTNPFWRSSTMPYKSPSQVSAFSTGSSFSSFSSGSAGTSSVASSGLYPNSSQGSFQATTTSSFQPQMQHFTNSSGLSYATPVQQQTFAPYSMNQPAFLQNQQPSNFMPQASNMSYQQQQFFTGAPNMSTGAQTHSM